MVPGAGFFYLPEDLRDDYPGEYFSQRGDARSELLLRPENRRHRRPMPPLTPNSTTVVSVRWGFNRFYSRSTQESAGFNLSFARAAASLGGRNPQSGVSRHHHGRRGQRLSRRDRHPRTTPASAADAPRRTFLFAQLQHDGIRNFWPQHSVKAGFDFRTIHDFGTPASGPTSLGFSDVLPQQTRQPATAGTGSALPLCCSAIPPAASRPLLPPFNDFVTLLRRIRAG